tara:strand:+ start:659 stop:871 length:213 start_codon:yes stop_codon:yes gene_type:complete
MYIGSTIIEIRILFFFRLIVNAAAMDPIKLIVGVPIRSVMNSTVDVFISNPRKMQSKGAIITTGRFDNSQ